MIERYTNPKMGAIWTDQNKYEAWLAVEILADEAWSELGHIPAEDVAKIKANAQFSIPPILEIEQETRHDVVAFTRAVSESLGAERKWVHYGLTSTDVVDTAYGSLLKQANAILRADIDALLAVVGQQAKTLSRYSHDGADTRCTRRTNHVWLETRIMVFRIETPSRSF